MKICVVGLGYIGLPTAAMFAKSGHDVFGVDLVKSVVDTLNAGNIHIEEPGLAEVIREQVKKGAFRAGTSPEDDPQGFDVFIIAVPTPNLEDEYLSCDISYVMSACESILPHVRKGSVVIVESTVAPRTMDDFVRPLFEKAGFVIGQDIYLAHCPERVLPGQILRELVENNRIIGGITPACAGKAAQVYAAFVKGKLLKTEAKTAEMAKCMENTFRDVNIALANELAKVCYELDINCLDVIGLANEHPRVNIHSPGPGVGGHCLAVDPYFISAKAPETARIIRLARDTNCSMPAFVVDKTKKLLEGIANPKIAAFGVTYKGNVDDRRESPALEIIEMLQELGYNVAVFDPHVADESYVTLDEACEDADLILILTDHNEYKTLDYDAVAMKMRTPQLFDTKSIIDYPAQTMRILNYGNLYEMKM